MSKRNNCYILFKLTKYWDSDKPKWRPFYYSRNGLVHAIARNPGILDSLSADMSKATVQRHVILDKSSFMAITNTGTSCTTLQKLREMLLST